MTKHDDECLVCGAFNGFKEYVKDGAPIEDAFKIVVTDLLDETMLDTIDEVYPIAHKAGFADAMRVIADQAIGVIEAIDEEEYDCDCDTCTCEDEVDVCDDCDCEDGYCQVDAEKAILRAILEDEK